MKPSSSMMPTVAASRSRTPLSTVNTGLSEVQPAQPAVDHAERGNDSVELLDVQVLHLLAQPLVEDPDVDLLAAILEGDGAIVRRR